MELIDWKATEATFVSTYITFSPYNIAGKPDKRYKSGWRVYPSIGQNVILNFTIQGDGRYQVRQTWQIENFGKYVVTKLFEGMVELVPISLSQNTGRSLMINNKLKMLYLGFTYVTEGSSL